MKNAARQPVKSNPANAPIHGATRGCAQGIAPPPPEREIPAVISILKERLGSLSQTARHLRERLVPALSQSNPEPSVEGMIGRTSPLAEELEVAISLANDVMSVLTDIHHRLEL